MSRPPGRGRFRGGRSGPQQQRMYEELRAPRPLTLYMRGFMGPRVVNIWNEPHEGVPFRPVVSAVPLASPPVVVDSTASGFCPDATIETNMQNLNLAQRNVPALLEMAAGESGAGFGEGQNIVGTTNGSGDLEPLSSSISNTMAEQINGSMSAESDAIFLPIPVILKSAAEKPLESNLVTEDSSAAGQTDGNNAQECQFFELFPTSEETEHAAGLAAASASIAAGSGYLTTARPDAALEFSAAATSNVAVNVATGTDVGTQSLAAVANTEVVSASGGFEAAPTSFEAGSAVGQYHSASNNAPRHPYYMHYSTTVGPAASAGFAMAIRAAAATGSMEAVRAAMVASAAAAAGTTAVVGPTVAAVDAAVAAESVESGRATAPSGFGATAPLGGAGFGPVAAVGNSAEFGSGTGPGAAEAPLPAGTVFVRRAAAAGGSAAFSHAALASGPIAYGSASAAAAYPATFNSDAAAGDPATFNPGALTAAAPDPAAFRDLPVIFNYTTYSRAGAVCQLGIRAAAPYVPATAPRAPGAFVPPRASVNGPSAGVFVRGAVPPYVGMPVRVGAGPPRPDSIYDEPCLIPCRPHDDSRCRVHRSTTNEGEYVNFPPGTLMILYGAGGEPYYADATVLNCDTTRSCNCSTRAECTHIERDDDGSPDEPCDYEALQELLRQINERGGLGDGRGGPGNGRGGPGDGRGGPGDGRGGPGDGRGGGAAGSGGAATGQGGAEDGRGGGATGHGGAGDGRGGGAAGHGGAGDGRGGGAAERGSPVDNSRGSTLPIGTL